MRRKYFPNHPDFDVPKKVRQVLGSEKVMLNGRVVTQSVFKDCDLDKEFEHLTADDFRLENQLANGVELKECKPLTLSTLEQSDNLVAGVLVESKKLKIIQNEKDTISSDSSSESDSVSK